MGGASDKHRVGMRKNRGVKSRKTDVTREFQRDLLSEENLIQQERVSGKGNLVRHRTVRLEQNSPDSGSASDVMFLPQLSVSDTCREGRVLRVHGLNTVVQDQLTGIIYICAVRRLLKTLATQHRHVVITGDHVFFRPENSETSSDMEKSESSARGIIERVSPRHGCLCRMSRSRMHTLVANVDVAVFVTSVEEPRIKPHLIDRMILMAEKMDIRPVICINKSDLCMPEDLMPLVGVYARMGYETIFTSTVTGQGISQLKQILQGRQAVLTGQSGVGKSSLLNAVEPGLDLCTQTVSTENQKGRHTTTTASLIPLACGGWVVDTPGIRQFELWDIIPEEVPNFFRDLRPLVSSCQFNNCTHSHEECCAVKDAVADGYLDERRYESYLQMIRPDTNRVHEE